MWYNLNGTKAVGPLSYQSKTRKEYSIILACCVSRIQVYFGHHTLCLYIYRRQICSMCEKCIQLYLCLGHRFGLLASNKSRRPASYNLQSRLRRENLEINFGDFLFISSPLVVQTRIVRFPRTGPNCWNFGSNPDYDDDDDVDMWPCACLIHRLQPWYIQREQKYNSFFLYTIE